MSTSGRPLLALVALAPLVTSALPASRLNAQAPTARPGGPPPGAAIPQAAGQLAGVAVQAVSGAPIPGAAVTVRAQRDSSLVGGAIARPDGSFRIEGLRPGRYTVRVRALGFAPVVRAVAVTPESPRAELGRVALDAVAAQLSGVQVQAQREDVALAPDRNAYAVKDMPVTSGGTAVDVLRNVPAVEVDGDNKISLRGNSGVVVQLNGRVSPLRGEALGNFLAQLPANMVAKVEVVSNPSAKNDPEGMAGIINIVLKQEADLGTSGALSGGGGSTGQTNVSGNLGHQQGRLTLFSSYGFMRDRRTVDGFSTRTLLADPTAAVAASGTALQSDLHGLMQPRSHSATASAEFKADARNTLSSNLVLNVRDMGRDNGSYYRDVAPGGAITGRSNQLTDQRQHDFTGDLALTWRRTVQPQKNALVVEGRVNHGRGDNDVAFSRETLTGAGLPTGTPRGLETNATDDRTTNAFAQVDWTRELRPGLKLETGYKGTFRRQSSDFAVRTGFEGSTLADDATRSNAFDYHEQVQAAYGVLSQHVGRVDLQAGLRLEAADTRFDLRTTDTRYDNDYKSAFPSAIASWNVSDTRQLKASYSKRINRPFVQQLNPFGFREDALTVFEGNPRLQPEYTHAYELGFQQSMGRVGTLQLTPFLRHTVGAVRQIGQVDANGILHVAFQNAATSDAYGTDATLTFRKGRLSGFGGASAFEVQTDAANLAAARSVRAFAWSVRANATFKVNPTLDLQAFSNYRSATRTEQGRVSRFAMTNVALRQKLRGDKLTATLRVMDPFGQMGWTVRADDGRVYQLLDRRFGARGAFLSMNYTFGQAPKLRPRQPEEPLPSGGGMPGMP